MGDPSTGDLVKTHGLRERNVLQNKRCEVQDTLKEKLRTKEAGKEEAEVRTFGRTPDGTGEPMTFFLFGFSKASLDPLLVSWTIGSR